MRNMASLVLSAFIVLALFPAAAHAGTSGSLNGIVLDSVTGKPVADALVGINSPQDQVRVKTDSGGHFVFINLEPGPYTINVEKAGYEGSTIVGYIVVPDQETTVTLRVMPKGRVIARIIDRARGDLVNETRTMDIYEPIWGWGSLNPYDSVWPLLRFVPGLTFGTAPRMMR